jgi:hypothetical protein
LRDGASSTPESSLLFPTLDNPRLAFDVSEIRTLIMEAFFAAIGRRIWPHLLRHAWVNQRIPLLIDASVSDPWTTDRRLKEAVAYIGHDSPNITLSAYFHLPWWLRAVESEREGREDRHSLTALAGLALRNVDQLKRRSPRGQLNSPWRARVVARLAPKLTFISRKYPRPAPAGFGVEDRLTVNQFDALLRAADDEDQFKGLSVVAGLTEGDASLLINEMHRLASATHIRLIPEVNRLGRLARTPFARRWSDRNFSELGERAINSPEAHHIFHLFSRTYRPSTADRRDGFCGPLPDTYRLRDMLLDLGVPERALRIESIKGSSESLLLMAAEDEGSSGFDLLAWQLGLTYVIFNSHTGRMP